MLYSNLANTDNDNACPAPLRTALAYLREHDIRDMEPGAYPIQGEDIYIQVIHTETDHAANRRPEVHQTYIDLQYSPNGGERIGFAVDHSNCTVAEDLLEERDLLFYEAVDGESFVTMNPGDYAVFFPWDVHRPQCCVDVPGPIVKAVVKIRASLL